MSKQNKVQVDTLKVHFFDICCYPQRLMILEKKQCWLFWQVKILVSDTNNYTYIFFVDACPKCKVKVREI